jgi:hypothetical protein
MLFRQLSLLLVYSKYNWWVHLASLRCSDSSRIIGPLGNEENPLSLRPFVRHVILVFIILLLMALALATLSGGLRQLPLSHSIGQLVETTLQLMAGILTLLVALTCFWRRKWGPPARSAWAISLVTAAGLSSFVWGPPMPLIGLLFALLALFAAWVISWALRRVLVS